MFVLKRKLQNTKQKSLKPDQLGIVWLISDLLSNVTIFILYSKFFIFSVQVHVLILDQFYKGGMTEESLITMLTQMKMYHVFPH